MRRAGVDLGRDAHGERRVRRHGQRDARRLRRGEARRGAAAALVCPAGGVARHRRHGAGRSIDDDVELLAARIEVGEVVAALGAEVHDAARLHRLGVRGQGLHGHDSRRLDHDHEALLAVRHHALVEGVAVDVVRHAGDRDGRAVGGQRVPAGRLAPAGGATTWYCVAPST